MRFSHDTRLARGAPPDARCSLCHQETPFVTLCPTDIFDRQGSPIRIGIGLCTACIGQLYQKTTESGFPIITRDTPKPLELEPFTLIKGRPQGA